MSGLRIVVGCDNAGFDYKEVLRADLAAHPLVEAVTDLGVYAEALKAASYGDIGLRAGEEITAGRADRAVLVCGTGIGMAIAANKVPGVRAAQAHDTYSAERARKSNDAQVVTLGARVIGVELAKSVVAAFLVSEFAGGESTRKVDKLLALDRGLAAARTAAPED